MLGHKIKLAFVEFLNKKVEITTCKVFMCTNLNRDAKTILKYYKARYQMKFNFRDAKQHTGLNHCQSKDKEKLEFQFNAFLSSINIAKSISRTRVNKNQSSTISIEDAKTELSNKLLLDLFI